MTQQPTPPLLSVEKEFLLKERATLLDRLTFVEQRLGVPSSVRPKAERRELAYTARVRETIRREEG